jgi:DNA repair protein RecO (recombination protein O)
MLNKTKGIVLSHLKYGDTNLVTTIYTESHGRCSFLVHGFFKHKSKFHSAYFQPLTLLDLEIEVNPKRGLQRIKEAVLDYPFQSVPHNHTKRAIALFLSEILYKTLKEEEPNPSLFDYLYHVIQLLDTKEAGIANFHLVFLVHLTKFLGFYPTDNYSETNCIFDPVNGRFFPFIPSQSSEEERSLSHWVHRLLGLSFEQLETLSLNHQIRNSLLEFIIGFYHIHLGSLGNIKSLPVLQSVFEEG